MELPNPDDSGGLQVTAHYRVVGSDTLLGIKAAQVYRYPSVNWGTAYTYPRYRIDLIWSDLTQPELTILLSAIDLLAVGYEPLILAGLGAARRVPYMQPNMAGGGILVEDQMHVTLFPGAAPQVEYVEGSRNLSGTVYGPVLYKVTLPLLGTDIQYLYEP